MFGKTMFSKGIPKHKERKNTNEIFIYPEELIDKKCGGCVRCQLRDHGDKGGYHCTMRNWHIDITPEDKACVDWWDKEEHERAERVHSDDIENRRKELWAIYAEKEPVKLPIVNDGYGNITNCPVCGEMPYSTEQCHWCGQRFIRDAEIAEYKKPWTEEYTCPSCGMVGTVYRSKYNGHRHFRCENCGCGFME